MRIRQLGLPEVLEITPVRHGDHRGFFSETYNRATLAKNGIVDVFVQDNHARSAAPGTLRGMHFQIDPHPIVKLIRVTRGSIFDVAVDVRSGSPTFAEHTSVIVSAEEGNQVYVPEGFAHGYMTLEPDTEVAYKVTDHWSLEVDRGFAWDDPQVGIDWPERGFPVVLSDKDKNLPTLAELDSYFEVEATR